MPDFDKEPDYYEVQNVAEIEDFDPDQYGNIWYNVKFSEDAQEHMWLAKEKPEEGNTYYGHFEPTKSGKRLRFKRDKEPEEVNTEPTAGKPKQNLKKADAYLRDASTTPIQVYNGSLSYAKELGLNLISDDNDRAAYFEYVKDVTDELLKYIDNIRKDG